MNDVNHEKRMNAPLVKARTMAFASPADRPGGLALFRQTVQGIEPHRTSTPVLQQMLWSAFAVGDMDFIHEALNALHDGDPAIEVVLEEPDTWPRGRQAVHCTATGKGWRFVIPPAVVKPLGLKLMAVRLLATLPMFVECSRRGLAGDGKVILNIADAAPFRGVGYCSNREEVGLIPDPDFMVSHGYASFLKHLQSNPVPWQDRRRVAFWRGATTGKGDGTEPAWEGLQRVHLCRVTQGEDAELFDVGLSRIQFKPGDPGIEGVKSLGYLKPYASNLEMQKYRYHIDIDGYTSAWSALFTKLATGCPVLKIGSRQNWRQWYYHRLVPWENYVPVAADLSDLADKTRWLIDNDDAARQIGAAGRELALAMTYEAESLAGAREIAARMVKPPAPKAKRKAVA